MQVEGICHFGETHEYVYGADKTTDHLGDLGIRTWLRDATPNRQSKHNDWPYTHMDKIRSDVFSWILTYKIFITNIIIANEYFWTYQ